MSKPPFEKSKQGFVFKLGAAILPPFFARDCDKIMLYCEFFDELVYLVLRVILI
jgi:hypothetical protein